MKVVIVGSGVMGSGIAIESIRAGYETLIFDIQADAIDRAKTYIEKQLDKAQSIGKISEEGVHNALQKLTFTTVFEEIHGDFIIEAIVEKLTVKQELFKRLELQNKPNCILASNTSSIPITQIASVLKNPERLVGVHFFNPAHIMKLVEIISGAATQKEIAEKAFEWASTLGKTAVYAADAPGFIVNRVARHYYVESLKALEEQVCDFEQMDRLMRASGFKMGPFELMDLIGVETNYSVTQSMFEQFMFDSKFRPSRIQKQKVDAGFYGRKTQKGFYTYEN